MAKRTFVLIVLDGWGIGPDNETNPVYMAKPQSFAWLQDHYPLTSIQASGIAIGLPWGEVGNSEVGHLTLGAGKVLYQYYPRITMAIHDGTFFENKVLKDACAHARASGGAINFVGLLTEANVHASLGHLKALIKMAERERVPKINLHLLADAKDSPPHTVEEFLKEIPGQYLASLMGRYYGMDRQGNWQLTETAYRTMTGQSGPIVSDPIPAIEDNYSHRVTEEYLPPMRFSEDKKIQDGDALFFFNYREDSIRQLASSFIVKPFDKFATIDFKNLYVGTMSHYEDSFDVPVAFPAEVVENPFGKVISDRDMVQLRLAESYKYAHVIYFFNGLREAPFLNEYRTLIPSSEVLHPEEHPEMMATPITDRLVEAMENRAFDFILVNYANPDTIAHTANYDAGLEAVRVIDREIGRVIKMAESSGALVVITGDHGNIEEMINPRTGLPESQHDPSPVPFYLIGEEFKGKKFINQNSLLAETLGTLADVAPTLLEIMHIPQPSEMTGRSLLDELV